MNFKFNRYYTTKGAYINFTLLYTEINNSNEGYGLIKNPDQGIFIWMKLEEPYTYNREDSKGKTI